MIKILQWNLENFFIDLQNPKINIQEMNEETWLNQGSSFLHKNKPLYKLDEMKKVMERENPDVMILCEIAGQSSLDNFNKLFLNNQYEVFMKESRSRRGIEVGFLVKKGLGYTVKIKTNRNMNLTPDKEDKRYFSRDIPELHLTKDDEHWVFLGVHLKSKMESEGDYMGIEKRSLEVKGLLKIISAIKEKTPSADIIIGGDFNGFLQKDNTESEFEELTKDFQDYHDLLSLTTDRTTFVRLNPDSLNQLDYLLIEPHLKLRIIEGRVVRYLGFYDIEIDHPTNMKEKNSLPSDHYPQVLSLREK